MKLTNPVLYTKSGCPWCAEAREVLDRHGIAYTEVNVTASATAMTEMKRVSGQSKAPVLDWAGEVLADFGASELAPFLESAPPRIATLSAEPTGRSPSTTTNARTVPTPTIPRS